MMLFVLFVYIFIAIIFPKESLANSNFVSIVNPVRISPNNLNPFKSINSQYEIVSNNKLPATWLLTFDVLEDNDIVSLVKSFSNNQEVGIFLEISEKFCNEARVPFDESYSWHHPSNIFLTGYKQNDRIMLIDKVFETFKRQFGYYPRSVGAWWIDAFSLKYMEDKYGIIANLGLSDQYSTDGYRVWGTYWSTPFYPSINHAGIPARGKNKISIVTIPWAPRDPLNGYYDSYYSTQDYLQTGEKLGINYFEKLVELYGNKGKNKFGHVVVGLESDLQPDAYKGEYSNQLLKIKKMEAQGELMPVTMNEFANWYINNFPDASPVRFIESVDLLGGPKKVFWYMSSNYRAAINYDSKSHDLEVFDYRVYQSNFREPYYFSPNKDFRLLIDIPFVIDKFISSNSLKWNMGELIEEIYSDSDIKLIFKNGELNFKENEFRVITKNKLNIAKQILQNSLIEIQNGKYTAFSARSKFLVSESGYVFRSLKPEAVSLIKTKRVAITILFVGGISLLVLKKVIVLLNSFHHKLLAALAFCLIYICVAILFYITNSTRYYVSQSEIEALNRLYLMDKGNVMVYDNSCFGCEWNSIDKPAVFDNKRNYVRKFSGKNIKYNNSVFNALNPFDANREFANIDAQYIYVVNYENYKEKVPFSPGDLGIELVYENANAQIWKRKL